MSLTSLRDLDVKNKRVMIREDLNVPIHKGKVTDDSRIKAALPTIQQALTEHAAVIILSHLGRPQEGKPDPSLSLAPVADHLAALLNHPVRFEQKWLNGIDIQPGEIVLCENVRFNKGEKADDDHLGQQMAALCDIYVMDAFATAHRAHASTHSVAKYAKQVCAGPLLISEINALTKALESPTHPVVAIVGGAKVSTKLALLHSLTQQVDTLIVGGGIANTFLAAAGYAVGNSLYEPALVNDAKALLSTKIPLPTDVITAQQFSEDASACVKALSEVSESDQILDIGPATAESFASILKNAGTILWNGPVGVFEFDQFSHGTEVLAKAIASSNAFSIAGGGDTLAAISKYQVSDGINYISTGGGAFLEFLEGKKLPAIAILESRYGNHQKTN